MAMLTINLPGDLLTRLQTEAHAKRQSVEAYVVARLVNEMVPQTDSNADDSLLHLIAQIKATPVLDGVIDPPVNPDVSALLATTVIDPNFDWDAYEKEWSGIEAELKELDKADAEADFVRDGILT